MLTLLLHLLLTLFRIEGLPGQDPKDAYVKPTSSLTSNYFEVLEQNSHIIYPLLAVLTLVLIVWGILVAWKSQDMDLNTRVEYKRAIIAELRRHLHGLPGDEVSRAIGLDRLKTAKLLEMMLQEGMVQNHTNSKRVVVWRVRGANTSGPGRYT
ncbi:hypothetical protein P2318_06475 [Myxococcaceae bacterium GXIMD 01537]